MTLSTVSLKDQFHFDPMTLKPHRPSRHYCHTWCRLDSRGRVDGRAVRGTPLSDVEMHCDPPCDRYGDLSYTFLRDLTHLKISRLNSL